MARPLTALVAMFAWALTVPAPAQGPALKVGDRHAEFTLPDIRTGKPVSLADFRGRKVLLVQFASW